jgi:anaerobic magnesium-protoporphyrin IX monomethyl ester cyclase
MVKAMAEAGARSRKKVLLLHCPGDKVYLHDYYTSDSSKANYYWPPSDLVLLSGMLGGFDLAVLDAIAEKLTAEEAERRILDFEPDAVVFTTGTATWAGDRRFLEGLKAKRPCLLIGSGSVFLFEADYFLRSAPFLDALILDLVSPEIAAFIDGAPGPFKTLVLPGRPVPDPMPGWSKQQDFAIPIPRQELFKHGLNRSPLARRRPFALVVTSIGCPYSCRFCVAGSMPYRWRNIDNVVEELRVLRGLGIREIMFNDPTFTVSRKRVAELCGKMDAEGMGFGWIANAHVATVSDEMMSAMREAGCHTVMMGVESAQDEILASYSKGTTRAKVLEAFRTCRRHKIKTLAYFIIGLPGETRESTLETIKLAKAIDCDFASFTVPTPDIGSKMREEAIAKGWLARDMMSFDSTDFPVFSSETMTKEEIWTLRQKAVRDFYLRPSYLIKKVLGIRGFRDLTLLLDQARAMFIK